MEPGLLVFSSCSVQLVLLSTGIMWSKAYEVLRRKREHTGVTERPSLNCSVR